MLQHCFADVIDSLKKYLEYVEENCQFTDNVLFRGQSEDWPLVPKLARMKFRASHTSLLDAEKSMMGAMKRSAIPLLEDRPESDWEWLAIAQHYGMATRLLDWTANPLAALWFAVREPAADERDGVVWVLQHADEDLVNVERTPNPFAAGETKIFRPPHINSRIIAQHGWFTAHHYRRREKQFVKIESSARFKNRLMKLRVPAKSFADIRYSLDMCGVNNATLFGDLSGLCRHLEWQHSELPDEVSGTK